MGVGQARGRSGQGVGPAWVGLAEGRQCDLDIYPAPVIQPACVARGLPGCGYRLPVRGRYGNVRSPSAGLYHAPMDGAGHRLDILVQQSR